MKAQGHSRPQLPCPSLNTFVNRISQPGNRQILPGLNKMPFLLWKVEINIHTMPTSTWFYIIGASQPAWYTALFDVCVEMSLVRMRDLMEQSSRICQALHRNRVPSRYPKKGNWRTTGASAQHHHQGGGCLSVKGNPLGSVWVHRLEQQFGLLYLKAACWKALPLNLMRQPFIKQPLPGCWGLVIVIHPKAFPGGKHGTVFPDQTWTLPRGSQTHCLVCTNISTCNWTAHPGSVFLLLYFTNVCVFLPAPLGKLPCFMATCHWQGISHQDWNLRPSPKLPALWVSELTDQEARPWK